MASEDKDYEQSALGQRVNELMDDGYDFGEAVKQAMSEGLKDGGSVGIEILFGPKRDNFRYGGDTMGGKNDKSKSSSGPDSSKVSAQQQSNHQQAMAAAQNDGPSFKEKVKSIVTNPAVQTLGGAVLTGGLNVMAPKAIQALNKARMIKNAIDYAKYIAPDEAIEDELENIQTQGGISPYADGGRVGLFMGGSPLEGEALSIYNSMNAYGNTDQQIADRLQALGMYTPPGSTPDPTPDPGQTIGYQGGGGGGGGGITTLDPLTRKSTPMDPNSFLGKTFSKIGDFTGSMMDKFSGTKVGEGITEGATKFKNIALTPMMALMQKRNPLNPAASNYSPSLQPQMNFLEGITGSRITGTSDNLQFTDGQMMIGRDPNSGLTKYGPGSVLSGQNVVSGFGTNDYEKALNKYLTRMNTYTNPTKFQLEKIKQAEAELKAEQERQAQATLASKLAAAQKEIEAKGYKDYGQGGASQATQDSYAGSDGSYAGASTQDYGGGEKDGGIIGYRNGGLATMFTRRR